MQSFTQLYQYQQTQTSFCAVHSQRKMNVFLFLEDNCSLNNIVKILIFVNSSFLIRQWISTSCVVGYFVIQNNIKSKLK